MRKRSSIWQIPSEKFKEIVAINNTHTDILNYFGLKNHGSNYSTLNNRIVDENINIDHIIEAREKLRLQPLQNKHTKKKTLSEILVKNSNYNRYDLKRRLIKEKLIKEECNSCGMGPVWNGKQLSLQLEHKNGINNDNRLENLCFLCPNCHSQTDNYAGKSNKNLKNISFRCLNCNGSRNKKSESKLCRKCYDQFRKGNIVSEDVKFKISLKNIQQYDDFKFLCKSCSNTITKDSKSGYCSSCVIKHRPSHRKVENRPSRIELIKLILTTSFVKIGKDYDVSDNAVRKWCKTEGLPFKQNEIKLQRKQLEEELKQNGYFV